MSSPATAFGAPSGRPAPDRSASGQSAEGSSQKRPTDAEALEAIVRLVAEELDARRLAEGFVARLPRIFAAPWAIVALGDEKELPFAVAADASGALFAPDAAAVIALGAAAPLRRRFNMPAESRALPPIVRSRLEDAGWGGAVGVPICNHQTRMLGMLVVWDRLPRHFDEAELRLAETLAMQVAVGLERAQLIGHLGDWTAGLQALLAFSAEINQKRDAPTLVRHLVEHAARFLKAEGGQAGLRRDRERGSVMFSPAYWRRGEWHPRKRLWPAGEGLPGYVLEAEFPCVVEDYGRDPRADAELRRRFGVESALAVPIKSSSGRTEGFFELHRGEGSPPFSWQDAVFLESLANTTAVAIENARLIDKLEVKRRQVQTLSAENVNRLEEMRRHIARELHDEAGQALVGIHLGLGVLAKQRRDAEAFDGGLAELRRQIDRATRQIKDLAQRLRPPTLDRLGLPMALQQLVDEYAERTGLVFELRSIATRERLSPEVETALFRIAQEAFTNIASHAGTCRVRVNLEVDVEQVALEVSDDGRGFEKGGAERGLGLLGMEERAAMLGGRLDLESRPGEGTTIRIAVPQRSDASFADGAGETVVGVGVAPAPAVPAPTEPTEQEESSAESSA